MEDKERVLELEKLLIEKNKEINSLTSRALKVHQKNEMLVSDPAIAAKMAEMDYQLAIARQFIKSGAFPKMNPEQAFTIMRAGSEMGMSEIESLNSLYVVNGSIEPYGKAMVAILKNNGWNISYNDETQSQVTVTAKKGDESITEVVTDKDQIIQRSKAAGFAKKNKMRFHGVRMILNFHLAHLIRSTSDLFDGQYHQYEEVKESDTISKFDKI